MKKTNNIYAQSLEVVASPDNTTGIANAQVLGNMQLIMEGVHNNICPQLIGFQSNLIVNQT